MTSINEKLLSAFNAGNVDKIMKYLELGADPTINEGILYKYASMFDNGDFLLLLMKYNEKYIDENDDIISIACTYNSIECIKILSTKINKNKFKHTDILSIILS